MYEIPLQSARYIHVQTRDGLRLKLACLMIHMGLARQTVVTIRERDTDNLSPSPR